MSKSSYWNKSSVPYNSAWLADALRSFRREDLADPHSARRWVEFAKQFSQMTLTTSDIEQLGFQSFYALKQIMAASLSSLSEETIRQNERISALEKEQRVLRRDLDNLARIEEDNRKKEAKLLQEYDRLQRKEHQLSLKLNEQEQSILGGAEDY